MGIEVVSREELSKLSDEELERLYLDRSEVYKSKLSKNRRIRSMLAKKVEEQERTVKELQKDLDDFVSAHPNIAKFAFDDKDTFKEMESKLKTENEKLENTITVLTKRKIELNSTFQNLKQEFSNLELQKSQIQEKIDSLDEIINNSSMEGSDEENLELAKLEARQNEIQDDLETLSLDIKDLQNQFQLHKKV